MSSGGKQSPATIGFYSVAAYEPHGLFGGLLLLDKNGRPREFHCTAPVKPNRAQEILYGASLPSYLYGEAIGQALLAKASVTPDWTCVDSAAALALREFSDMPTVLVMPPSEPGAKAEPLFRVDAAHDALLRPVTIGRHRLAVHRRFGDDETQLAAHLAALPEHFDLLEPFARIRGAIEEAQRGGR